MKKCPYCAEEVQDEANKCKHCGEALNKKLFSSTKKATSPMGCLMAIGVILVLAAVGAFIDSLPPAFVVNDRVIVVDDSKQLTGYIEGSTWGLFTGKSHVVEIPDSEKAINGETGTVVRVGYQSEKPFIKYYTDGTQKVDGYAHAGERAYTVELDSGKRIRFLGGGLQKER